MLAGSARRVITPQVGVFLGGNGEFQSTSVHDDLYARVLVLDDGGGGWTALVSLDLVGIEHETVEVVRGILTAKGCGAPENVLISSTHCHNGPHTRFNKHLYLSHRDDAYMERLHQSIAEAILEADADKVPVVMRYARGYAFENFNRRITMPGGETYFYSPRNIKEHPEIVDCVHGIADPELCALRLTREDGTVLATAVHYAAHPLTFHDYCAITSDFCGSLVRHLEAQVGGHAVYYQGACGSLHSKGLFAGPERMEEMGQNLCAEAVRVLAESDCVIENTGIRTARKSVRLPVDNAKAEAAGQNRALFTDFYEGEMNVVVVGPLAFVGVPGEILCEPGLQIKWNSPFAQTWVLYNCNGYASYISHRRAYTEGGYESGAIGCLKPEACDIVMSTADQLLQQVGSETMRGCTV